MAFVLLMTADQLFPSRPILPGAPKRPLLPESRKPGARPQGILLAASTLNRGQGCPVRVPNGTSPGFRETASGALNYVGNDGFCYSRSGSGGYGVYLNFGMTELSSSSAYYRGYGFQLRCLSE